MLEIAVMAISAAMGMLFLILKIAPIRKILTFDIVIDIAFTTLLMWSMSGTYTGIMVAIIAGGLLSMFLYILKIMFPPDSLTAHGWVKSEDPTIVERFRAGVADMQSTGRARRG